MPRPKSAARVVAESEVAFERLQASIDPDWIDEALEATGTATLRKRRLPAEQVIWLVLGMALYRDRRIDEVVAKLDLALPGRRGPTPASSSVTQARARLGDEPLRWLFERCSEKWAHESARSQEWRGLAVYGIDGTTVRVPGSVENRAHFGGQGGGREGFGYPIARIVTLMVLRTHLVAAMRFGPYSVGETTYAKGLWAQVPDNSLVIVDRGLYDAAVLFPLQHHGANRHWLTRTNSNLKRRTLETLGAGDELVEAEPHHSVRDREPTVPRRWVMRNRARLRRGEDAHARAFRGDPQPKADGRGPRALWAVALAYNLLRFEMTRIAEEAGVPPMRISFAMALSLIRDEWCWCAVTSPGAIPKHLRKLREDVARFVLPPRRTHRSYPRAVKLKMSNYARKARSLSDRHWA